MKQNYKKNQQINLCPMRQPSKVMKLERLGSFHQTRLSFTRQLINELKSNKTQFEISKWDIDNNGFGNAVIKTIFNNNIFYFMILDCDECLFGSSFSHEIRRPTLRCQNAFADSCFDV